MIPPFDAKDYLAVYSLLYDSQIPSLQDRYASITYPPASTIEILMQSNMQWEAQEAFVTGYYEPVLKGSLTPSSQYSIPLYQLPTTEDKGYSRAEIAKGALQNKGLELCWVQSSIDAFFLEIQGSGRIELEEGGSLCVGYAGQNGHPYKVIGKYLVQQGFLTLQEATLQGIKKFLSTAPNVQEFLNQNPSYVYFKEIPPQGPIGTLGLPLTPEKSLAVDPVYIPLGSLVWVDINHPSGGRLQRFMVAQDTGGAIKGPGRADFFWGCGSKAEENAGKMKSKGTLYVLKPCQAKSE